MWSTELDGINNEHNTWDAAGRALAHYITPPLLSDSLVKPEDTYLIAHSHGGNVVAFACGKYGLKVNGLVTVGTPVRKDLYAIYEAASSNISRHLHLYAGWRDYWQAFGALFDGRFGIHREHPFATRNDQVPKGDHGSILRDREFFRLWLDRGWLEYWKG
jgi:pimeloyl-ACP methyl ester carboxylesterase